MNTEPNNFYDWAKDKPESTNFAGLGAARARQVPVRSAVPWSRLGLIAAMAVAAVAALKLLVL